MRDVAVKGHPGIFRDTKTGAYGFVVDVPRPDGRRGQMKRRGFRTIRLAEDERAKVLTQTNAGSFVRPTRTTVASYLRDEWLPARRASVKPSTASSYAGMIESYVVPHIGRVELAKVDGGTLNALYAVLLAEGRTGASGRRDGLSPKTVRNVHGMLHRAFADAVRWRRIAVNPSAAADQPRKPEVQLDVWSGEEMRAFLAATIDDRLAPVWRLLLTTGMRRGEVCGLRWHDVDLTAGRVSIRHTRGMVDSRVEAGTPKTRSGSRTIALDPVTVAALRAWRRAQTEERLVMGAGWLNVEDLLVTEADGSPVHPQVLSRRFKAAAQRAGVKVIRLHDTRHSYATAALAAGVPVKVLSQRLGHADITVTLRVYAHVLPGDDEVAAARVAALFDV